MLFIRNSNGFYSFVVFLCIIMWSIEELCRLPLDIAQRPLRELSIAAMSSGNHNM
jgi:hypothetical protein